LSAIGSRNIPSFDTAPLERATVGLSVTPIRQ
jgi:hypothetical protein